MSGGTSPARVVAAPALAARCAPKSESPSASPIRWRALGVSDDELRPSLTLTNGQSFAWRQCGEREWRAVVGGAVVGVRETDADTHVAALSPCAFDVVERMRDYFNLQRDLSPLYAHWGEAHPRMKAIAGSLRGVRVLRQDPVECLFSFICSSCNNIQRITSLVGKLSQHFGTCVVDDFFAFPSIESLAAVSEERLRELGFGYRARFITQTAARLIELGGQQWLADLRSAERTHVQDQLVQLHGVGRKVADCVALFSLDKHDVVPVDTHVLQIARRDFPGDCGPCERLSDTVYESIGNVFRTRFGPYAGWAHSLMFTGELRVHQWRLPEEIRVDTSKQAARGKAKKRKAAAKHEEKDQAE